MRLNEDGTAEIEFERTDGSSFTVKIKRPTVGQFKRLRMEAQTALKDAQRPIEEWGEQVRARKAAVDALPEGTDPSTVPEVRPYADVMAENDAMMSERATAWWRLVLIGDDTFRALGDKPADVAAVSTDDWPSYLVYGAEEKTDTDGVIRKTGTASVLLTHWQEAPLDRGAPRPVLN